MRFLASLLVLGLTGCLIPADIEEQPPETNFPPFFHPGSVAPRFDEVYEYDPRTDGPTLELGVYSYDDPNIEDPVFWRWFVDYNRSFNAPITNPGGLSATLHGQPITFGFRPCQIRRTGGEVLHTVELLVSDRGFELEAIGQERPGQTLPEGAGSFHLTWFIHYDDRLCP